MQRKVIIPTAGTDCNLEFRFRDISMVDGDRPGLARWSQMTPALMNA